MADITLRLHACVIEQEGVATDDEGDYFDGAVDFDLVLDGTVHRGLIARVKQAAGSSFAEPLEVQWPDRFVGRLPYQGFRECVDRYVRHQVARQVLSGYRASSGAIRTSHLRLPGEATCTVGLGTDPR